MALNPSVKLERRMVSPISAILDQPTQRHAVRSLLIVARDQPDLWRALQRELGDRPDLELILDRRRGERRQSVHPVATENRRRERRSLPHLEDDLRVRRYLLARPHYRRPQE